MDCFNTQIKAEPLRTPNKTRTNAVKDGAPGGRPVSVCSCATLRLPRARHKPR